jgi:hypothetical protein
MAILQLPPSSETISHMASSTDDRDVQRLLDLAVELLGGPTTAYLAGSAAGPSPAVGDRTGRAGSDRYTLTEADGLVRVRQLAESALPVSRYRASDG